AVTKLSENKRREKIRSYGQAAGRGSADGVVGAAEAQHRHGRLVVSLPAGGAALGPAEEGFFQLPQRAAAQHPVHVHHLGQGPHVPGGGHTHAEGGRRLGPAGNTLHPPGLC
uniref:Uncharacterized protein n=1 Tax=Buteo japonicus TaxID=224669 RepID=A0A8C0B4M3_9AVES